MKTRPFLGILALILTSVSPTLGQTEWHDPLQNIAPGTDNIHGRGFAQNNYARLPDSSKGKIRNDVWGLAQNSSGLYLTFTTESPEITVRYGVTGGHAMPHMPATGVSGVDLYTNNGERCWGNYSFGRDTITYSYNDLGNGTKQTGYTLYLPLYNGVKWLEVGTKSGSNFSFQPINPKELPIVAYGTSIMQGACASRPGMAWSNILHRTAGLPVVNLGFSGNGRLEPEVIDYVTAIPASLYIVDCMPNMYVSEDSVYKLVVNAVRQIRRQRPDTPILLVEHPGYANHATNATKREEDTRVDRAQRRAYTQLQRDGIKHLHYLNRDNLAMPADGMVDHIHPSDYGMEAYAKAYRTAIGQILKLKTK